MIKFFRHIRKDLMEKNKTGKYFKYAIGEVVLVVIGILIALQLNNLNEKRKINNDVERIFTLLEQELESNIQTSNAFLRYGYRKDSIITLFKNDSITPEMIRASPGLIQRDFGTNTVQFLDDRLDEIIALEKQLPSHFQDLIPNSKKLKTYMNSQRFWESESLNLAMSRIKEYTDTYPWFGRSDSLSMEKAITHALTDPIYRNKVKHYNNLQLNENVWDVSLIRSSSVALLWQIKMIKSQDKTKNIKEFFHDLELKPLLEYSCQDKPYKTTDINFRRNFIIYNNTNDSITIHVVNKSGEQLSTTKFPPKKFYLGQFTMQNDIFLESTFEGQCKKVFKLDKEDYLLIE